VKEPRHFIVYCRTKNGAVEIARVLHDGRHILRLLPASYLADGD
jgi:plasmid stabilization system protein ParE